MLSRSAWRRAASSSALLLRLVPRAEGASSRGPSSAVGSSAVGRRLFGLKLAALYQYSRAQRREEGWNQRSGDAIAQAKEIRWHANKAVCSQLT